MGGRGKGEEEFPRHTEEVNNVADPVRTNGVAKLVNISFHLHSTKCDINLLVDVLD